MRPIPDSALMAHWLWAANNMSRFKCVEWDTYTQATLGLFSPLLMECRGEGGLLQPLKASAAGQPAACHE